jgi:hypothetical protein
MSDIILKDMPLLAEPSFRYHQLPDGSMVDVYAVTYDCKVDIEKKKFICRYDNGYEECTLPTLNDLYQNGTMSKEGTCIEREHDITLSLARYDELTDELINAVIDEFKANGLNVTYDAIMHNYKAWRGDFKSGYRDVINNYHLFSPCGCNPLSFRASSLHPKCAGWQETYIG